MRAFSLIPIAMLAACASAPKAPPESAAPTGKKFDHIDASNIAEAQAAGYKVVNEKGKTLFCKKTLRTGTRLGYVTACLSESEWRAAADAARDTLKQNPSWRPPDGN